MVAARPDVLKVELRIGPAATWVDVTSDVELGEASLTYSWGRTDRFGQVGPSVLGFELVNNDPAGAGRYTPDNPASPYFGAFVEGVPARWSIGAYDGPTPATLRYRHWYGEVQSINPIFPGDSAASARVQVSCVDILARLGRTILQDLLTEQTLLDGVSGGFWLLDDQNGSAAGAESSPLDVPELTVYGEPSQIGFGGGTGLAYDGKGSVLLNGNADIGPGWFEVIPGAGAVFEAWVSYTADDLPLTGQAVLAEAIATGGNCYVAALTIDSLGRLGILADPVNGNGRTSSIADGRVHHVAWFGNHSSGFHRIYVDGVNATSGNSVLYGFSRLRVGFGTTAGWQIANSALAEPWRGTVSRVAVNGASIFNEARIPTHYAIGAVMQESAPDRIVRLLTYLRGIGITATFDSLDSGAVVGPQETQGKSLLAALGEAWAGEGGRFWTHSVQYGGAIAPPIQPAINFAGRLSGRPAAVSLALDVEADLQGSPSMTRNTTGQVAIVTASSRIRSVTVQDDDLAAAIGPVSTGVPSALIDAGELAAMAQDRIAQARTVRIKVTGLGVDAFTASVVGGYSLWGALLALEPGDRVRLTGLPAAKLGFSQRDCYVLGASEDHGIDHGRFTLALQAADDPAEFVMEDALYGRVSSDGDLKLSAPIASATALSMSLAFTTVGLTTDAEDFPLDLDVGGERVTISTPPAGSTSPQTVAIAARGAGGTVARAHATNELVDAWLTPSVAW